MTHLVRIGDWEFAPDLHLLKCGSERVRLERKHAEVLAVLARRPGEVFTRDELLTIVWSDVNVTEEVLTNAIYTLRRVFADDAKNPRYIETIPRRGYRLVAKVGTTAAPGTAPDGLAFRTRSILAGVAAVTLIVAVSGVLSGSFSTLKRSEVAAIVSEADSELERGTPDAARRALAHYDRALKLDPDHAPALAGRGIVRLELAGSGEASKASALFLAERDAMFALRSEVGLSDAHLALGLVKLQEWDWSAAEKHLRLAAALDPRSGRAHAALGEYLLLADKPDEARSAIVRAKLVDGGSARVLLSSGFIHTMLRDRNAAIADYERVLLHQPDHAAARRQLEKLRVSEPLISTGSREALMRSIDALLRKGEIRPAVVAGMFAEAGDTQRALEWLERAREQKDLSILLVRLDDRWEKLHSEPRLRAVLAGVGPR